MEVCILQTLVFRHISTGLQLFWTVYNYLVCIKILYFLIKRYKYAFLSLIAVLQKKNATQGTGNTEYTESHGRHGWYNIVEYGS